MNDKKFPPLLPRKLRVMRAKGMKRNTTKPVNGTKDPNIDKTTSGRAGKLLGRAGAAQIRFGSGKDVKRQNIEPVVQPPEKFVFEGMRAKRADGNRGLKFAGKRKSSNAKRTQRSTAWKSKQ